MAMKRAPDKYSKIRVLGAEKPPIDERYSS
jgi:hypothetical protein